MASFLNQTFCLLSLILVSVHRLSSAVECLDSKNSNKLTLQFFILDQSKADVPYYAFLKDDDFGSRVADELGNKFRYIEYGMGVYGGLPRTCQNPACFALLSPIRRASPTRQTKGDVYLERIDRFPVLGSVAFALATQNATEDLKWAFNDDLTVKVILLRTDTDVTLSQNGVASKDVLHLDGSNTFDFSKASPELVGQLLNKHDVALIPIVLKNRLPYWNSILKRMKVNGKPAELSYRDNLLDTWEISKQVANLISELFDCSQRSTKEPTVETTHVVNPSREEKETTLVPSLPVWTATVSTRKPTGSTTIVTAPDSPAFFKKLDRTLVIVISILFSML